jgi:hypothetical protein
LPTEFLKFPRTPHIQGSRLQNGDEDLDLIPFGDIRDCHLVIEEKVDGANCAISFTNEGKLQLQSRGRFLQGGRREKQFELFKVWAAKHQLAFHERLGSRYVMYGEWLYAKHTVFYDRLPHYFLEFDILDSENETFLSSKERKELLADLQIVSVPILGSGNFNTFEEIADLLQPSTFRSPDALSTLKKLAIQKGLDPSEVILQSDTENIAEGLYIKIEKGHQVVARCKFVRSSFETKLSDSSQPLIPNQLRRDVLFF